MRFFIIILFFSLPCSAGATIAAPMSLGETAIAREAIPAGFTPKKHRLFERFAEKIIKKRIYKAAKALGAKKGDGGQGLSTIGFISGLSGVLLLILAVTVEVAAAVALLVIALLLGLAGLVLCQMGIDRANAMEHPKIWVKALAYTGLGLNLLLTLTAGAILFLALTLGADQG